MEGVPPAILLLPAAEAEAAAGAEAAVEEAAERVQAAPPSKSRMDGSWRGKIGIIIQVSAEIS